MLLSLTPAARLRLALERLEDRTLLSGAAYDPTSLLVRFRPEVPGPLALAGTSLEPDIALVPGLRVVRLAEGMTVESALAAYRGTPGVLYAEPNYVIHAAATPNDPRYGDQWALQRLDAGRAWDANTGSGRVVVAVSDSGITYNHADLRGNVWTNAGEVPGNGQDDDGNGFIDDVYGYDFVNSDGDPLDDNNDDHGTEVSGILGAVGNNGTGIAGVSWNVKVMALKTLDRNGQGTSAMAIRALNYAVANGATISNHSYGCRQCYSQGFFDAIQAARAAGHLFVAAAGNDNLNLDVTPFYPASYNLDNILSVAASTAEDERAWFSNYGRTSVDLAAPGIFILTTLRNGGYGELNANGTSMAAPHVAGVAALIRDMRPHWTYTQIINRILSTVDVRPDFQNTTVSGGILNAGRAVPACSTATQVTWTGGGGDQSWHNLRNWDSCALPGADNDVVINIPIPFVIQHTSGQTEVRSLTSQLPFHLAGGSLTVTANSSLSSDLTIAAGATLRSSANLTVGGWFNAAGTVQVQGGTLRLTGWTLLTGAATVSAGATLDFAGVYHGLAASSSVTGPGALRLSSGFTFAEGTWNVGGATNVTGGQLYLTRNAGTGPFTNAGTVWIDYGVTLTAAGGYTQTAGETFLFGATLTITGGMMDLQGGALSAAGTINGSVRNAARLNVGSEGYAGYLRIAGNYTQTAAGILNVDVGAVDTFQFDHLEITGHAALDGVLNVALLEGFVAREGDLFVSAVWASRTGMFRSVNVPNLGAVYYLDPLLDDRWLILWTRRR